MIEGRSPGRRLFDTGLAVVAALLATFAAGRAREAPRAAVSELAPRYADIALEALPLLPSPLGDRPFWIGGWVGPRADDRDPSTWRAHADAGIGVSMGPLEDRYHRRDNVARLAFLDSLRASGAQSPFVFVRDDSLHPDETTRPGWEARVAAIVRAHGASRSLAGYFLADEPAPSDAPAWAPAARLLRKLDPLHPAYVNFLPIPPSDAADPTAAASWRSDVTAAIAVGELALFTFSAYPFGPGDEQPHFLATMREAARVSHATERPFGVVLQWTGHGDLRAVTRAEALYQATQALAHGASGITWFTYWTPNPDETPWHWHGGAIAYGGAKTARYDTLTAINERVRALAEARGAFPMHAAHYGGEFPAGFEMGAPPNFPGVVSVTGGPATLGATAALLDSAYSSYEKRTRRWDLRYVLANRDRMQGRRFEVTLKPLPESDSIQVEPLGGTPVSAVNRSVTIRVNLGPGDATVLRVRSSRGPPVRLENPRTPNRSDKR